MKNSFFKSMVVVPLMSLALSSFASDHGIGEIKTSELDLVYVDHVLSGRIGNAPIYGVPLKNEFGLNIQYRLNGRDFESTMRSSDGSFSGIVASMDLSGEMIYSKVIMSRTGDGVLSGKIGNLDFRVTVTVSKADDRHHGNSYFTIEIGSNPPYQFQLRNTAACMGCLAKISYSVVSILYAQNFWQSNY